MHQNVRNHFKLPSHSVMVVIYNSIDTFHCYYLNPSDFLFNSSLSLLRTSSICQFMFITHNFYSWSSTSTAKNEIFVRSIYSIFSIGRCHSHMFHYYNLRWMFMITCSSVFVESMWKMVLEVTLINDKTMSWIIIKNCTFPSLISLLYLLLLLLMLMLVYELIKASSHPTQNPPFNVWRLKCALEHFHI
jgi:hypothetical protein